MALHGRYIKLHMFEVITDLTTITVGTVIVEVVWPTLTSCFTDAS
jgi:hypothetical protein